MYPKELLLSDNLRTAHRTSWQAIGEPGDFYRRAANRNGALRTCSFAARCANNANKR